MYQLMLILHVLGATVWTGGHLVLAITILPQALRRRDAELILSFESRYERVGIPALVIQVVTGIWLAFRMLPDPAAWFGFETDVASHIGVKLLLLLLTAAFAVDARMRIIPHLRAETLPSLAWHIIPVTIFSVLFVVVGVGLGTGGIL
ncbi:MAG: copper resistance protein CopD [Gemmatimonadales bacterium]|nr:copper resistance protein CopD [Gemmatimonadales bacterium]